MSPDQIDARPALPSRAPSTRGTDMQVPLRVLACGSVDDGKSTLLGRLLVETLSLYDDQIATLRRDSKSGVGDAEIDLALILDGLEAEREQKITIDVAYRYFRTATRSFILIDAPGHEQYVRNMVTGASDADLAIVLVDASQGVLPQTRRHALICALLGIRSIVLAVNKMDKVDYDEGVFRDIVEIVEAFAARLGPLRLLPIPLCALRGDNVAERSARMDWYAGPTLLDHLEIVDVESDRRRRPFRFPVQWVNRPDEGFRGYAGTLVSGEIGAGDPIVVARSGQRSHVDRIVTADGDLPSAAAGDAVTLTLADHVDLARGDVLCRPHERPVVADQFSAHVISLMPEPLLPGRSYLMRIGHTFVGASLDSIVHRLDTDTLGSLAATEVRTNEIALCQITTAAPVAFDLYDADRETGAFILIDRYSNATVAAGLIRQVSRQASDIHRQALTVSRTDRERLNGHKGAILWFTGLPGSGKSTIADEVERRLLALGVRTYILDGDNVRFGLCRDLGFTAADRVENVRRVGEVAKLMLDAGIVTLCCFISPFEAERRAARKGLQPGEFLEIFVDTPLAECVRRDPKGLYAKAARGEMPNLTGIDSPYESPSDPDLRLTTEGTTAAELASRVVEVLRELAIC